MQQATTIKRFRSHPLYIVSILWKYLFILLVPVIRGLYYVIINSFSLENGFQFAVNISNWAKGAWMDIVFLLAFLSLGVLLWLSFTIEVSEEGLLIKRGVLKREVRFLPVSRYNCLSVVSPMIVRLFGGVYLRVDTPGGGLKQADLLMLLRTKDCRQIIKLLQLPDSLEQPAHTRSYTPKNRYVFVLAMVTSNSFAGVLLISTFVTQAGNILGEQFSEMLYGTFENVTRTLAFGVPPVYFVLWLSVCLCGQPVPTRKLPCDSAEKSAGGAGRSADQTLLPDCGGQDCLSGYSPLAADLPAGGILYFSVHSGIWKI